MNQPDPAEVEGLKTKVAAELVGARAAPFDLTITEGEAQVVAARIMEHVSPLLAALATAEERRDQAEFQAGKYAAKAAAAETVIEAAERAEGVLRKTFTVALTVKPTLDEPYKDDPRWTPWTRWVEPVARRSHDLHLELKKLLANYHKATGPQAENEGAEK